MVEWLNPQPGQHCLEPSAGHGAIARFFRHDTENTFVEPSHKLLAELSINAKGTAHQHSFEDFWIGNKFDRIAMNPPFGTAGKTAIEHVAKAVHQLKMNGVLYAIIPDGSGANKRLLEFFEEYKNRIYHLVGELRLPSCTFERAGTSVVCKIIKVVYSEEDYQYRKIDLSYCENIKEFFEVIKELKF